MSLRGPLALGLLAFVAVCVLWLPDLGGPGLLSEAELPAFDRARAALGEALSGLERHPPLPEVLRTVSYDALGGEVGLRLPHLLASAALVGLAVAWTRILGHSMMTCLVAGALATAFPMVSLAARTTLGNPVGELMGALAILGGLAALGEGPLSRRGIFGLLALAGLAGGIASSGLLLGMGLPLAVLALLGSEDRRIRTALGLASLGCVIATAVLVIEQGDGYIPLLGAAKDLELLDKPQARRFAAGLEDFGYQVFPWAGLLMIGATVGLRRTTDRGPALWMLATLVFTAGWSSLYGSQPIPLTIPAAVCGALAVERFVDPDQPPWERRVSVFLIAATAMVMAKDGELVSNRLIAPTALREGEHTFPDEPLEAGDRLRTMGKAAFYAVVVGGLLGRRRRRGLLERAASKVPDPARDLLIRGAFIAGALGSGWMHTRVLLPRTAQLLSPKIPLQRHIAWAESGALPITLGVHRIRDPGLELYASEQREVLPGRRELQAWFQTDEPAVAVARISDYPHVFQASRREGFPIYVLDDSHARHRLIANRLPDDAQNLDPLADIVLDEVPPLEHTTSLRFENYIEVVGWQIDGPLRRGKRHTLEIAIEVLRPLPGGSKLYARMLNGKLSRIGGEAHELTDGLYPCNLWRKGDVILHRWEFETPPLEVMPGDYDLLLGLRRSQTKNFKITVPPEEHGEYGVHVRGSRREFAKIGTVEVW